ncbi:MAG TPA: aminoglycoside 6-adenylyltransferase [Candidatus Nitrosopolaris sp.]|nr:aminoglycoside 6-adenylyltransferase [Candidatus Nitrosopolaris sp.]
MESIDLARLTNSLKQHTAVHAAWLEGSRGEGTNDEFSDMDIWVDVDDGREEEVYEHIESFLRKIGELDVDYAANIAHPLLRHRTYHIAGTNPFERLEINMQSHSRNFRFTEGVHNIKVLFDKDSTIKMERLNKEALEKELASRKRFLLEKIEFGELWVEKEIRRRKFLEALGMYNHFFAESIVELCRIKYSPYKISHGLKHIYTDLPQDIVRKIESIHQITSIEDIKEKITEVKDLAKELF